MSFVILAPDCFNPLGFAMTLKKLPLQQQNCVIATANVTRQEAIQYKRLNEEKQPFFASRNHATGSPQSCGFRDDGIKTVIARFCENGAAGEAIQSIC